MSGKKQGAGETPAQAAMMDLAMRQVQDFKTRWLPIQRNLAEDITRMGADGSFERRQAAGVMTTETEAQFAPAREKMEAGLAATGGLGSSKAKLAIAGMGEDQATATGLGRVRADAAVDDAYTQGLSTIMALGRGQKAQAVDGMARNAAMSGRQAQADASAALANRMGNAQLVGQAVGLGAGIYMNGPQTGRGLQFGDGINGGAPLPNSLRAGG